MSPLHEALKTHLLCGGAYASAPWWLIMCMAAVRFGITVNCLDVIFQIHLIFDYKNSINTVEVRALVRPNKELNRQSLAL